jgi:hypothetical protein
MFFTRIGKAIAYTGSCLSILRLALAFYVASIPDLEASKVAAQRYLGTANSGEAIDRTLYYLLIAIALGILCEISSKMGRDTGA